ncbi:hypothetical protein LTR56_007968 [Elasticomyces elasticus]|nr:hypothetical protein LTR56_007968 [Elasticomyces elasticus]KAK3649087.1 hypothetical protein LTR22_013057 [Elasticomyces elasticus]KAK4908478.1 hypothetical protein LTR49_022625 [Elasticomyces elasticus]KAK5748215.1 hypothetical protein LTS12_021739 [Elasticomyces elasticus]
MAAEWATSNLRMFALESLGGAGDSIDDGSSDETPSTGEYVDGEQDGSTIMEGRSMDDAQSEPNTSTEDEGLLDLIASVMNLPIRQISRVPQSPTTDSMPPMSPPDCEICGIVWDTGVNQYSGKMRSLSSQGVTRYFRDFHHSAREGCVICSILIKGAYLALQQAEAMPAESWETSMSIQSGTETQTAPGGPLLVTLETNDPEAGLSYPAWLEYYATDDHPLTPVFGLATHEAESGVCRDSFERIKQWISECDAHHEKCRTESTTFLPTRLLEVSQHGEPNVRLIETSHESFSACPKYVALSYCWGAAENQKLTKESISQMKEEVPWSTLPRLIRDAVIFTTRLGLCYLWVDSLCIIQDDDQQIDWIRESARMGDVYASSYLTLAATSPADTTQSFFTAARSRYYASVPVPQRSPGNTQIFVRPANYHRTMEPLHKRAWTLQEFIVSRRVLEYTSREAVFHCNHGSKCECGTIAQSAQQAQALLFRRRWRDLVYKAHANNNGAQNLRDYDMAWLSVVQAYSGRALTRSADRLPALAGVAQTYQHMLRPGDTYLAGLWKSTFIQGLAWQRRLRSRDGYVRSRLKLPADAQAPSWSWTSVEGSIAYMAIDGRMTTATVDRVICEPVSGLNPWGKVASEASMTLTGPVMDVAIRAEWYEPEDDEPDSVIPDVQSSDGHVASDQRRQIPGRYALDWGAKAAKCAALNSAWARTCFGDAHLESVAVSLRDGQSFESARRCRDPGAFFSEKCRVRLLRIAWIEDSHVTALVLGYVRENSGQVVYQRLGIVYLKWSEEAESITKYD